MFGRSDLKRWGLISNLMPEWDSRTEAIATLIPQDSSVLEFGAGRQILKNYLPERCRYTPSDICDRGEGTFVCDLNSRELPAFPVHDVTVFSGVLEYINNVPRLISILSCKANVIIASYALMENVPDKMGRRAHGWVNDYSLKDLEEMFAEHNFVVDTTIDWNAQKIFKFVRKVDI